MNSKIDSLHQDFLAQKSRIQAVMSGQTTIDIGEDDIGLYLGLWCKSRYNYSVDLFVWEDDEILVYSQWVDIHTKEPTDYRLQSNMSLFKGTSEIVENYTDTCHVMSSSCYRAADLEKVDLIWKKVAYDSNYKKRFLTR